MWFQRPTEGAMMLVGEKGTWEGEFDSWEILNISDNLGQAVTHTEHRRRLMTVTC